MPTHSKHEYTRADREALAEFRQECRERNEPCWLCGQAIDYEAASTDYANGSRFERDHYWPVSERPDLQHDPAGWRASHSRCNKARSNNAPKAPLGSMSRAWVPSYGG